MKFPDGSIKEGYFDNNVFKGPKTNSSNSRVRIERSFAIQERPRSKLYGDLPSVDNNNLTRSYNRID